LSTAISGCLQYFTGVSGRLTTYNYNNAQGVQLANQAYSFCVRMEAGFCGIRYTQCPDTGTTVIYKLQKGVHLSIFNALKHQEREKRSSDRVKHLYSKLLKSTKCGSVDSVLFENQSLL
jgi:hypothetical protein